MKRTVFMLACLFVASMVHAQPAQTNRATSMRAQAQSDAASVAALPANTKVEILNRSGVWSEVKTDAGQTGWVRAAHLKVEAAAAGANPVSALAGLLNSGRTSSNATVTTGVRGLQEEDLQNAQANPEELKKMQGYAAGKNAAQSFAQRTKLTPVTLEYLENPAPAGSSEPANNGLMGG